MTKDKFKIKGNAGALYTSYALREVFSHTIDFNTAYEVQERMHWILDHSGMFIDKIEKSNFPENSVVTISSSSEIIPNCCIEKLEE